MACMNGTRERILSEGLEVLTLNGLSGITLGLLAEQTGMSKSGLFAHFGSKEELQLELLSQASVVGALSFVEPAMHAPLGLERLRAVFQGWIRWTEKAGLRGGCPIAAGMFELDDADAADPLRLKVLEMERRWRGVLEQLTTEAIGQGELAAELDVEQFVWEMCGIYLTHHVSYRFLRDQAADTRALRAFEGLIARSTHRGAVPRQRATGK